MPETTTAPPPASDKPATAAPTQSPGAPPPQSIDDVYGEFDTIESGESKPAPKSSPPPKPKQEKVEEWTDKIMEDKGQKPGQTEKAPEGEKPPEPKPVRAADLRTSHEALKKDHYALKAEYEKLRKSIPDTNRVKQLEELLDSERKSRTELENELKLTAYERSAEFKDKFHKPYIQAYSLGRQKAASLKVPAVLDEKNDMGEIVKPGRPGRQGTEADFDAIMRIDDDDAAAEKAIELFGQKAQSILYYRERVNELHQSSRAALEEYRTNADKREKEVSEARTRQEQEQQERAKTLAETFKKLVAEGEKAHPEFFTPIDGDDESAAILERGGQVADSLFNGVNPKTGRPYTPDGLVKFHAFVRNAIKAHGHLVHTNKALRTKLEELESDLAEFKKSGSSADSGRGETAKASGLAGDEEFEEIEARSGRHW